MAPMCRVTLIANIPYNKCVFFGFIVIKSAYVHLSVSNRSELTETLCRYPEHGRLLSLLVDFDINRPYPAFTELLTT